MHVLQQKILRELAQLQQLIMEESSSSWSTLPPPSSIYCDICMDKRAAEEMFRNSETCPHLFCKECISNYVAAKVEENISVIECPDLKCKGVIGPQVCRSIVAKEVLERWEINLICQSLIPESEKFYCPYKDCSALLVDDGGEVVTASECPICRRLFCAQCKVSWHSGMECEEFQSLTKEEREREDLLLIELANGKNWRRCPRCRIYVDRKEGCLHITCRCGFKFCYGCGASEHSTHDCPHTRDS